MRLSAGASGGWPTRVIGSIQFISRHHEPFEQPAGQYPFQQGPNPLGHRPGGVAQPGCRVGDDAFPQAGQMVGRWPLALVFLHHGQGAVVGHGHHRRQLLRAGHRVLEAAQQHRQSGAAADQDVIPSQAAQRVIFVIAFDPVDAIVSLQDVPLRAAKQAVNRGLEVDLASGCAIEIDAFSICMTSPDAKEGTSAFLEKRKAEFKGGLGE